MPPKRRAASKAETDSDSAPATSIAVVKAAPFADLTFSLSPLVAKEKESELRKIIGDGGGNIAASISKKTTFYVAVKEDLEEMKAKTKSAKLRSDVSIVSADFVIDSSSFGKLQDPEKYPVPPSVAPASPSVPSSPKQPATSTAGRRGRAASKRQKGSQDADVATATAAVISSPPATAAAIPVAPPPAAANSVKDGDKEDESEEEEEEEPQMVKQLKKGRAVVDPFVPNSDKFHVYEDSNGVVYDAMLNQTEINVNNNKFYLIQVLKSDSQNLFYTWTRWGRVGYEGQSSLDRKGGNVHSCISYFEKKFYDKTKNWWEDRANFEKKPGKYFLLERDLGEDSDGEADADVDSKQDGSKGKEPAKIPDSTLPSPVQQLMGLIFDADMFKMQMMEIGYDAKKMPLGKLTKNMIQKGYQVLKRISDELAKTPYNKQEINALSSDFYTIIPHDFKMRVPQAINTPQLLKSKLEMVEALGDIQIATSLIKSVSEESEHNPLDVHYKSLNCGIQPIDRASDVFRMIVDYVKHTHAATHSGYRLEVEDVFDLERDGEDGRFRKLHNRKLLWHGSRLTNWVGILSQGLRIAPPEAPSTGYMFGKGVYFADMVSKSANYCFTSRTANTGLLLLCEVALGTENELLHAEYNAASLLGGTKHSTKGVGMTQPDSSQYLSLPDGVVVPSGKSTTKSGVSSSLLYNEFIVYDVSQIKMRYLVKMKFNYR